MRLSFTAARLAWAAAAAAAILLPAASRAESGESDQVEAKVQATYVWQSKPAFAARYTGPNSLTQSNERGYSFSATGYLGVRPWRGGEFYFNPEVVQGAALSHLQGLGGATNGENQKTTGPNPTPYVARAFLRQTWNLGAATEPVESDANRLAGTVAKRRIVLTVGKLAVTDLFDRNEVAADPRTRFLNWSFLTHGSFDYAADARGYSWGAALEWFHDDWALRAGRFAQPRQPNGLALDDNIGRHYGDQLELEHQHHIGEQPGTVRLLVFRNRAVMARYEDALALAANTGAVPDLNAVRFAEQTKHGIGLALEQQAGAQLDLFARISRADGRTETYAFTDIDRSVSAGGALKGGRWGRADDAVGVAFARNGLSAAHRQYLAAGGMTFFLGDGRLNYRPENILETYYSLAATKHTYVTLDWQHIVHPGYNADRGPVNVASVRLHAQF